MARHFVMRADVTLFTLFTLSKILGIKEGDKKPLVDGKDGLLSGFTIKGRKKYLIFPGSHWLNIRTLCSYWLSGISASHHSPPPNVRS